MSSKLSQGDFIDSLEKVQLGTTSNVVIPLPQGQKELEEEKHHGLPYGTANRHRPAAAHPSSPLSAVGDDSKGRGRKGVPARTWNRRHRDPRRPHVHVVQRARRCAAWIDWGTAS